MLKIKSVAPEWSLHHRRNDQNPMVSMIQVIVFKDSRS